MGTGSGKPLRWMLRLSRHTGREHHSWRGERRKCLMFNQDSVPGPSHCPLCCRDPTHCGEGAGGRRCFTSPQPEERQQEVEAGGGPEPGAATYFLPLAPPPQLSAFPRPAQPAHNLGWWPHRATLTALSRHLPPQLRWPSLASTTNGETSSQIYKSFITVSAL